MAHTLRKPGGYATISDPDRSLVEMDTFTCCHCNRIVHVKPKAKPEELGGFCRLCMSMTCPNCDTIGTCDPFERKLLRMEASYHARRSYG